MTIGDLKRCLSVFDEDFELTFGTGDLTFYRAQSLGDRLVQIEFNEIYEVEGTEEARIAPPDLSFLADPNKPS
jgi:hypothetical protein